MLSLTAPYGLVTISLVALTLCLPHPTVIQRIFRYEVATYNARAFLLTGGRLVMFQSCIIMCACFSYAMSINFQAQLKAKSETPHDRWCTLKHSLLSAHVRSVPQKPPRRTQTLWRSLCLERRKYIGHHSHFTKKEGNLHGTLNEMKATSDITG